MAQTIYDSLHNIPLDDLSDKVGGRARLTRLVSLRLRMLNDGGRLLVEQQEGEALLATVCREIMEGKISLEMPEAAELAPEHLDNVDLLGLSEDILGTGEE